MNFGADFVKVRLNIVILNFKNNYKNSSFKRFNRKFNIELWSITTDSRFAIFSKILHMFKTSFYRLHKLAEKWRPPKINDLET